MMKDKTKLKRNFVTKENVIGFCSLLLLVFSFLFLIQQFYGYSFGSFFVVLSGYETIFGAKKEVLTDVNVSRDVIFNASPIILIFFSLLLIATALNVTCFVLRLLQKGKEKTILILNLVSGLLLLIVGATMFFYDTYIDLANPNLGYDEFEVIGVTTPSICLLVDALITLLNSIGLFSIKKAS